MYLAQAAQDPCHIQASEKCEMPGRWDLLDVTLCWSTGEEGQNRDAVCTQCPHAMIGSQDDWNRKLKTV